VREALDQSEGGFKSTLINGSKLFAFHSVQEIYPKNVGLNSYILNQIEGNVLQPLVMGRQVHLNPAAILIAFLVLGTLLGYIIGALLAVPTAVFVRVLLDELTSKEPPSEGKGSPRDGEPESKPEPGSSSA
jgi:hypothetical protein